METSIIETSTVYNNQNLKDQQIVLDIYHQGNTDYYINPIDGQDLYDKKLFINNGIKLNFLKTEEINYPQFNNEFVPGLSIIDIMMFNPPEKIRTMLNEYELI